MDWQMIAVAVIVVAAVLLAAVRVWRALNRRDGCGCGCDCGADCPHRDRCCGKNG